MSLPIDPPKPSACHGNVHFWAASEAEGTYCICGKAYSPKQPYGERVAVKAGETREFPEGFKVTFPFAGFWQVTVKPQEDLVNSKAAIMVMRL
jgi:hypothetical protein